MKKVSKIQWHGSEVKEGQAVPPVLAKDEVSLEGLHEGEIYVSTAEEDPAFFIRTNRDNLAKFEKITISQLRKLFINKDRDDETEHSVTFNKGLETLSAVIREFISSEIFSSGLLGSGFSIYEQDGEWIAEFDRAIFRKAIFAFEFIINRARSIAGDICVSSGNGKIKSVETRGDDYILELEGTMTFVPDDFARCQVYGNNPKYYWVKVKAVEGKAIIVPVSEFTESRPDVGDELVQLGNETNTGRQSAIYISASESGVPYVDVYNGINKRNLEGTLKTRMGGLDSIKDNSFPADRQPNGYGLYSDNCFLKGVFLLSTGEDVLTKFLVMENLFRSEMENLRNEIQEKDNYLSNSAFASNTDKWETTNDIRFFTVGNKFLFFNGNFYSNKKQVADIIKLSTRNVLRIKASGIKQTNADLARKPKYNASDTQGNETAPEFFVSFRVRVLDHGVLTIGFPGQGLYHTETLEPTDEFIQKEYSGTWDGTGDFEMKFTGDAYFYSLALTDNAFEEMYTKFSTKIEQTNERIELLATATSEMGDKLQSSIEVTAKDISLVSEKTNKLDNTLTSMGIVIDGDNGNITQFVKKDGVISSINQTSESVSIDASKINLNGAISANGNVHITTDGILKAIKGEFTDGVFSGTLNGVTGTFKKLTASESNEKVEIESNKISIRNTFQDKLINIGFQYISNTTEGSMDIYGYSRGQIYRSYIGSYSFEQIYNGKTLMSLSSSGLVFYNSNGDYFNKYLARGSNLEIVSSGHVIYTLESDSNCYVSCYNDKDLLLNLPASPSVGTRIEVKRISAYIKVSGNGHKIFRDREGDNVEINRGDVWMFVYDGTYWCANVIGR